MTKAFIIITTINDPTDAVRAFAEMKNYQTVVVGDRKTNKNWQCEGTIFISYQDQLSGKFALTKLLPQDHYSRKMAGYLYAISLGAEIMVDTDDDNFPLPQWQFPSFDTAPKCLRNDLGFVNIYQLFTSENIWPRGLPLKLVGKQFNLEEQLTVGQHPVGIWQGLADGNPDVDAIHRLINQREFTFSRRQPIGLGKGTLSPFNSQNTAFCKALFPLLYLPVSVSFRYTDILRGFVAQPIMWLYQYTLGFTEATVVQNRNPHDLADDFLLEMPMYRHGADIIDIVSAAIHSDQSLAANLRSAYVALAKKNIVQEHEIETLDAWLADIESVAR